MLTLPKAITFDCYGTLIDWERAIQQFFAKSLDSKGFGNYTIVRIRYEYHFDQLLQL